MQPSDCSTKGIVTVPSGFEDVKEIAASGKVGVAVSGKVGAAALSRNECVRQTSALNIIAQSKKQIHPALSCKGFCLVTLFCLQSRKSSGVVTDS